MVVDFSTPLALLIAELLCVPVSQLPRRRETQELHGLLLGEQKAEDRREGNRSSLRQFLLLCFGDASSPRSVIVGSFLL